jgi:hypothetical protein
VTRISPTHAAALAAVEHDAEIAALKHQRDMARQDRDRWQAAHDGAVNDLAALRQAVTELADQLDADAAHYAREYDAAPDAAAIYARADAAGNHADRLRKLVTG